MASSNTIRRIYAMKDVYPISDITDGVNPIHVQVGSQTPPSNRIRSKRAALTYNHVAEKFTMPISIAAKELGVSTSTLKYRCRELGIPYWPYLKIKSLATLESSVLGFARAGSQHIIRHIREEMEAIMDNLTLKISDETKDLRYRMYELKKKDEEESHRGCLVKLGMGIA
ncbi:RWP-RK domain protein [Rhynchospora pubera]|uniref:RWP-RK domain protein n=1 Tax=Rhynchospora pubera TaxID=906938 RepID=A0AAV8FTM1_9POAL|nr:RWP-RK domain protein [Rhynchospora pubera]